MRIMICMWFAMVFVILPASPARHKRQFGSSPDDDDEAPWSWGPVGAEAGAVAADTRTSTSTSTFKPGVPYGPIYVVLNRTISIPLDFLTEKSTRTTTTTTEPFASVVSTEQPPRVAACLARCRTTSQYNPVCANDGKTYHNRERLNCQNFCTGSSINYVRMGTCKPL